MNELDTLKRHLFERGDGYQTVDFKVLLGRDSDATLSEVAAEINKALAQVRSGYAEPCGKIDGGLKVNVTEFLASR